MFNRKPLPLVVLLLLALLAACTPDQAAQPTTEPGAAEPPAVGTPLTEPPAAETPATGNAAEAITAAAVAQLAAELGLTEADVTVLSAVETEFSDGCLGLGGAAESCLQAITPGWLLMLSANGQEYEVHSDATGQQVRIAGLDGGSGTGAIDAITASAAAVLADELGIAPDAITVVSAAPAEFTDGCLGLGGPAESCLQAITPGWVVTLSANGQEYVTHTDVNGTQVRIAAEGSSAPSDPDAATAAAVAALAKELGVAESTITVASLEAVDYTDSCLGLGQADESCAQVIMLGWLIRLDVAGQTYEVHTDGIGQLVRIAPSQ